MICVIRLDHTSRHTAEAVMAAQRRRTRLSQRLLNMDRMPGLVEEIDDVVGLPLVLLGAMADEQLVGELGYMRIGSVVDIDRLHRHPAHFRKGAATRLLVAVNQIENGAERFEVSTASANTPAVSLYQANGYDFVGTSASDSVALSHFVRRRLKESIE